MKTVQVFFCLFTPEHTRSFGEEPIERVRTRYRGSQGRAHSRDHQRGIEDPAGRKIARVGQERAHPQAYQQGAILQDSKAHRADSSTQGIFTFLLPDIFTYTYFITLVQ